MVKPEVATPMGVRMLNCIISIIAAPDSSMPAA
jgi:hypothetical protein